MKEKFNTIRSKERSFYLFFFIFPSSLVRYDRKGRKNVQSLRRQKQDGSNKFYFRIALKKFIYLFIYY